MTVTIVGKQGLQLLCRGSSQCSRTGFAIPPASQRGALYFKTPKSARSTFVGLPPSRRTFTTSQSSKNFSASRSFSSTPAVAHGDWSSPNPGEELYVTFVDKEGDEHKIAVSTGDNLLDIAQANDIEMEGACGGSCACSTCHIIVEDEQLYDLMSEPDDDENDMLDLAFGLTETSRLGCQVVMNKELDGLRVKLPNMTRNMQASDFSKKNERSD